MNPRHFFFVALTTLSLALMIPLHAIAQSTYTIVLERDGATSAYFKECSGIGSENDIIEFIDGGTGIVHKIPGRLRYTEIHCARGITSNLDIWDWRKQVEQGDFVGAQSNITISILDQTLSAVAVFRFIDGWPSAISAAVDSVNGPMESLTIAHDGFERES